MRASTSRVGSAAERDVSPSGHTCDGTSEVEVSASTAPSASAVGGLSGLADVGTDAAGPFGDVPPEVVAYYEGADEQSRLTGGLGLVEFDRTRRLVERCLSSPPCVVVDAGCGGGAYGLWLAELGYEVHVSDPVAGHVDAACAAARLRGVESRQRRLVTLRIW